MARVSGALVRRPTFTSWLADSFARFVALKRASGASYESGLVLLRAFDRYLQREVPEPPLRRQALLDYLRSLERLSSRGRDNAVGVVWQALAYASCHGAPVEALPARPPSPGRDGRLREPEILSQAELRALMAAARALPPRGSLRGSTSAILIGLLYATGLRIAEALALDVADFDAGAAELTVRCGKFGKARLLPIRKSVAQALEGYLQDAERPVGTGPQEPLFVSLRKRRLGPGAARLAFVKAAQIAELPRVRPHDLRHTFAVGRVRAWYREGRDVDALLPVLSTYLGHASVEGTRVYLRANGLLFAEAAVRFEEFAVQALLGGEAS